MTLPDNVFMQGADKLTGEFYFLLSLNGTMC